MQTEEEPGAGGQRKADAAGAEYEVSEQTLRKATRCWCEFSCLRDSAVCMCKVERCVSDKFLFVKPKFHDGCPYHVAFGSTSSVCGCPVRKEIYDTYGV